MGNLLDEEASKSYKYDDREKSLKEAEAANKKLKSDLDMQADQIRQQKASLAK